MTLGVDSKPVNPPDSKQHNTVAKQAATQTWFDWNELDKNDSDVTEAVALRKL